MFQIYPFKNTEWAAFRLVSLWPWFKSGPDWHRGFLQLLRINVGILLHIRTRKLCSTNFQIHYSPVILACGGIEPETLTVL